SSLTKTRLQVHRRRLRRAQPSSASKSAVISYTCAFTKSTHGAFTPCGHRKRFPVRTLDQVSGGGGGGGIDEVLPFRRLTNRKIRRIAATIAIPPTSAMRVPFGPAGELGS